MIIEINKDIEAYQESVVMGLTAKQLLFSIASVIVGGGLVLLLYPYTGLTLSVYIAIPVVAPIALGGFYTYNGMSFYEYMRRKIHFAFGNRAYSYVSTEGESEIVAYRNEVALKERQSRGHRKRGWKNTDEGRGFKSNAGGHDENRKMEGVEKKIDKKSKVRKGGGSNHGVIQ